MALEVAAVQRAMCSSRFLGLFANMLRTTRHSSYMRTFKSRLIMQTAICTLLALSVPGFAAASFAPLHLHGAAHKARGLAEAADSPTTEGCNWSSEDVDVSSSQPFSSHI